jgi:hypothetical protein
MITMTVSGSPAERYWPTSRNPYLSRIGLSSSKAAWNCARSRTRCLTIM